MKKIKKILLGALSVLTLGLFVVTGTKVNAADKDKWNHILTDTTTNSYITFSFNGSLSNISSNNASTYDWQGVEGQSFTQYLKMSKSSTASSASGVVTITSSVDWDATLLFAQGKTTTTGCTITSTSGTVGGETSKGTNYANFVATITGATDSTVTLYNASGKDLYLYAIAFTYEKPADGKQTVTYTLNGGELPTGIDESSMVDQGTIIDLPTCTKAGYLFTGWTCSVDNENYTDEDTFTVGNTNVTFTANWTKDSSQWCTITFDSNGGSAIESTEQIKNTVYTLPSCTKTGYYLTGWSDENDTYSGSYTVPNSSSVTLTAQWAECIEFDESCYFTKGDDNNTAAASNTMFTVSGKVNTNSDAPVSYNGQTYNTPLKMESTTSLTFTITKSARIYIAFTAASGNCKIQGGSYESATKMSATNGVLVLELTADNYTITKGDTHNIGFIGLIYDKASLDAYQNTGKTSLKFIGTLEEITDLSKIDSIELVLKKSTDSGKTWKDTNSRIYLSKVYEAVTFTKADSTKDTTTYAKGDNYYVVYRIDGISADNVANGTQFSMKLVVTYDGSTFETITKVFTWNN